MRNKQGIIWASIFIVIFLLTQDYLFIKWKSKIGWLGLPSWLAWFMLIHILFLTAFYFFSKKYWK